MPALAMLRRVEPTLDGGGEVEARWGSGVHLSPSPAFCYIYVCLLLSAPSLCVCKYEGERMGRCETGVVCI